MNFVAIKSICNLDQFLGSATSGKSIFGMQVVAVTKNPFLKKPGIDKVYFVDNLGGPENPPRIYCSSRLCFITYSAYRGNKEYDRSKRIGFDEKISIPGKCCQGVYSRQRSIIYRYVWMILLECLHFCC